MTSSTSFIISTHLRTHLRARTPADSLPGPVGTLAPWGETASDPVTTAAARPAGTAPGTVRGVVDASSAMASAAIATVTIRGEVDAGNAHSVQACLDSALTRAQVVVVDLSGVSFMDCAALAVLLSAARHAARRGGRLVVAEPRAAVRMLLDAVDAGPVLGGDRTVAQEQAAADRDLSEAASPTVPQSSSWGPACA